ncbi:MAG: glycosyltransferase family 4 protein [candidate division KSB1 bacterium]|nr:glycosyltransferase family 4 protein [candidate division KSB1 bacterium]MDZ7335037.1 glycosyltransferase family 4 protein [candidate division KSB1 bacterium]MDZ7357776.1 glycosyltransferase family 4 protein [candidate division KSB1 bacterium]MDZ7399406.1 glycosyltransferase family 4 protein [candidate division KSB1 bacterium]
MKILWVAQKDLMRDLDISTWIEMCRALGQNGHHVTLVTLSTSPEGFKMDLPGVTIKEIRAIDRFPLMALSFHIQLLWRCCIWLINMSPDVILCHPLTVPFLWPARLLAICVRPNCKFVVDLRTVPVRNKTISEKIKNAISDAAVWMAVRLFHGITVVSYPLQKMMARRYRIDPNRIGVWMAGVNVDLFEPNRYNPRDLAQHNSQFTILYHGAIAHNRGLFETVNAMKIVIEKLPQARLMIIGQGLAYARLASWIDELNLGNYVQLRGKVNYQEIPEYIARADLGIVPLPDEFCWQVSTPLKLFEYLAMAKPVLVSPIEAHLAVAKDNPAAVFLQSTSPQHIAEGILTAYHQRHQLARFAAENRQQAAEQFSWSHRASQLVNYITSL